MPATESQDKNGNAAKKSNPSKAKNGDAGNSASAKGTKASGNSGID